MSLEKEVREVLGEASVQYKKLDQLVRQGMMSPAALPILHRGLDKMQAGQVLNPQEREAVNKVLQSMLYIVTGDDTVFQKARQHTQKTRYQTEEVELLDEGDFAVVSTNGPMISKKSKVHGYVKSMPKGKNLDKLLDKHGADRVIHKDKMKSSNVSEEVEQLDEYGNYQVGIKGSGGTTVKARSDKEASQKAFKNMGIADRHRKTTPHTVKKVGEDTVSEESPAEDNLSSSYKAKFAAMLKKTGKSLKDMSDDEKKAFFNKVDDAHDAKDESVEEGAMSRMDYQQKSGEKGSGLETFKKKPAPKDTLVASPKTQRVKRTTAAAAKKMVSKGAVYAEDAASDQEEIRVKTQKKLARMSKMKANAEKETDPGIKEDLVSEDYGATQNAMAHAKKDGANYNDQSVAHKYNSLHMKKAGYTHFQNTRMGGRTYNKMGVGTKIGPEHHQGLKEDTFDEASAYADARRAMKADSKGMAPTKKTGGTKTYAGTKAGEERHGGHIVMQLRKAVSIGKPVKFKDGKEHKVSKADAHKFLSKYNSSKPADREKMHSGHDNHDTFQSHINNK